MSQVHFQWNDEYNWNIATIDREHKKFLKILQKIATYTQENYSKAEMKNIAYALHAYIDFLAQEEEILEGIAFPDLLEHKKVHEKIAQQIVLIIKNVSNLALLQSKTKAVSKQLFLRHMREEDTQVKRYLVNHNITLAEEEVYEIGS